MEKLELMMISQYGTNKKGFTLLEVLVAIVILAFSFAILLKYQTTHIKNISLNFQKLEALKFFKIYYYGLKVDSNRFSIKKSIKYLPYNLRQVDNIILDRDTTKPILTITTYER